MARSRPCPRRKPSGTPAAAPIAPIATPSNSSSPIICRRVAPSTRTTATACRRSLKLSRSVLRMIKAAIAIDSAPASRSASSVERSVVSIISPAAAGDCTARSSGNRSASAALTSCRSSEDASNTRTRSSWPASPKKPCTSAIGITTLAAGANAPSAAASARPTIVADRGPRRVITSSRSPTSAWKLLARSAETTASPLVRQPRPRVIAKAFQAASASQPMPTSTVRNRLPCTRAIVARFTTGTAAATPGTSASSGRLVAANRPPAAETISTAGNLSTMPESWRMPSRTLDCASAVPSTAATAIATLAIDRIVRAGRCTPSADDQMRKVHGRASHVGKPPACTAVDSSDTSTIRPSCIIKTRPA